MRGYLHGGLLIDFVGVLGPVGKWKLVGVDLLVCALQCCILAVFLERAAMRGEDLAARSGDGPGTVGDAVPLVGQDHDSEERGMLRTDPNSTGDIELQTLGPSNSNDAEERDDLLAEASPSTPNDSKDHPLDTYNTGEHVVANLHILDTLRRQWSQYGSVAAEASTSSTTSSQAAMAAAVAGRRFGFRLRVGNRLVEGPS